MRREGGEPGGIRGLWEEGERAGVERERQERDGPQGCCPRSAWRWLLGFELVSVGSPSIPRMARRRCHPCWVSANARVIAKDK